MSRVNSNLKLKFKLLSQDAVTIRNKSSFNYTKYSTSLNEIYDTAPSLSCIHSKSNKSKKFKSKFLFAQVDQGSTKQIKTRQSNSLSKSSLNSIPIIKHISRPTIKIASPISNRAANNCLDIMRQGLTKQNIYNSLLITIANINKAPKHINFKNTNTNTNSNSNSNTNPNTNTNTSKSSKPRPKKSNNEFRTNNGTFAKYLAHDLHNKFNAPFSLINSCRFKQENRLIHDLEIPNYDEMNALAIKKTLEDNFKIEGTVSNIAHKIVHKEKKKTNRLIIDKFIRVLIRAAIDFQRLHISLNEFYSNEYLNVSPFQNKNSQKLIQNIKRGNIEKAIELIMDNKYLVRDFDYFHLTPLHWAAKRNRYTVISQFVSAGANVNSQDCIGRTPLHYAVICKNIESLLVLLYEMALPSIKDKSRKCPSDYTTDYKFNYILHRTETLHSLYDKVKQTNWKKNIRIGLLYCFIDDLKLPFNFIKYRIIENNSND